METRFKIGFDVPVSQNFWKFNEVKTRLNGYFTLIMDGFSFSASNVKQCLHRCSPDGYVGRFPKNFPAAYGFQLRSLHLLRIYIVLSSLSPLRSVKPTAGDAEPPGYVLPSFRGGHSHGSRIKLLKPKLITLVERSSWVREIAFTGPLIILAVSMKYGQYPLMSCPWAYKWVTCWKC